MTMGFEELCQEYRVTPTERDQLAWHLATLRMRRTYETLRTTGSGRTSWSGSVAGSAELSVVPMTETSLAED